MNNLDNKIIGFYNENGLFETFKHIMSYEQVYLFPRNINDDYLAKVKELALLGKGERSLIWFLNNFDLDNNRSIVSDIRITYDSTMERKISTSQIKVLKSKVKKLSSEKISYYKSFIGVFELDRDTIQSKSVRTGLSKIYGLYTVEIPNFLDYDAIIKGLSMNNLNVSKQDLIAFLSLVLEKGNGKYFSIAFNLWESFFGRRKISVAKLAFERQGLITKVSGALPGFKSARYKLSFTFDRGFENTDVKITSIRTLEKISRVKIYIPQYSLSDKIEALKILNKLHIDSFDSGEVNGRKNLTNIFLRSKMFGGLICDLETMNKIVSESLHYVDDYYLANHLLNFLNSFDAYNFTSYSQFTARK